MDRLWRCQMRLLPGYEARGSPSLPDAGATRWSLVSLGWKAASGLWYCDGEGTFFSGSSCKALVIRCTCQSPPFLITVRPSPVLHVVALLHKLDISIYQSIYLTIYLYIWPFIYLFNKNVCISLLMRVYCTPFWISYCALVLICMSCLLPNWVVSSLNTDTYASLELRLFPESYKIQLEWAVCWAALGGQGSRKLVSARATKVFWAASTVLIILWWLFTSNQGVRWKIITFRTIMCIVNLFLLGH